METCVNAARRCSRRTFVQGAGLALVSTGVHAAPAARPFFARHHLPIGLQLYTLGDLAARDMQGALRTAREIGYGAVEIADHKAVEHLSFVRTLRELGMTCNSMQVNPLGEPGPLAESAHALGVQYIMTSMVPYLARIPPNAGAATGNALIEGAARMTADDWKRSADELNETGRAFKRLGLKLAYHNHNHEFAPRFAGKSGYDILLASTDPSLVCFELDVGWVAAAGRDPVALMYANRGRFTHMHVKDTSYVGAPNYTFQQRPADVGSGVLDWKKILPAAYDAGVRSFYVEREPPFEGTRIDAARKSFDFLNALVA